MARLCLIVVAKLRIGMLCIGMLCIGLLSIGMLSACSSGCVSLFAPSADLIDSPIADELGEDSQGSAQVDHSTFAELLEAYVNDDTARVDYAGLKADQAKLDAYLDQIESTDLEGLGDDESLALLINAYNAFTLKLIVENYPEVDSIKDIDSPWKAKRWVLGGHKVSLNDLEHGLIRPLYKDSRIHFAVNCASVGCPPLADSPYTGDKIDEQLDRAARRTLGDQRYARVQGEKLMLTNVMNWYRSDFLSDKFTPHSDTLPGYAARYADKDVKALVKDKGGEPAVGFIDYDWSLNDVE
jgi:hypothetical protein